MYRYIPFVCIYIIINFIFCNYFCSSLSAGESSDSSDDDDADVVRGKKFQAVTCTAWAATGAHKKKGGGAGNGGNPL